MAILTHKLMAKSPRDTDYHCVGVYDSLQIAESELTRWQTCFYTTAFKVVPNK